MEQPRCRWHEKQHFRQVTHPSGNISGDVAVHHPALSHHQQPVAHRDDLLQAVLGDDDGSAQFPVQLAHGGDEIRRGNGIQLGGRLVQDEEFRLHDHDSSQVQQLLLTAGKGRNVLVEPALNAEIRRHFRHAPGDHRLGQTQIFQPEGQFMPDLVRHELMLRPLHHVADAAGGFALGHVRLRFAVHKDGAGQFAQRSQLPLHQPQQGRLSAARRPADRQEFALLHRQGDVRNGGACTVGIGEGQLFDLKQRHLIASFPLMMAGSQVRQPYAM